MSTWQSSGWIGQLCKLLDQRCEWNVCVSSMFLSALHFLLATPIRSKNYIFTLIELVFGEDISSRMYFRTLQTASCATTTLPPMKAKPCSFCDNRHDPLINRIGSTRDIYCCCIVGNGGKWAEPECVYSNHMPLVRWNDPRNEPMCFYRDFAESSIYQLFI